MTNYKLVGNNKGESLVVVYEHDDPVTVPDTHPRFTEILDLLRSGNATDESVEILVNTLLVAGKKLSQITDRVSVAPYGVFFDDQPLRSELADVLLDMAKNDKLDQLNSVAKFLEKAASNQTMEGIDALYRWIQNKDLVITSEGNFLGYKAITRDDDGNPVSITAGKALVNGEVFEGQIPNNVGDIVSMPRNEVTDKTSVNCGPGLHAGTYEYANWFKNLGWSFNSENKSNRHIILVEMNPRDVVSVPDDHNCAKLRVSKYKVLEEIEERLATSFYEYEEENEDVTDGDFTDEDEVDAQPEVSLKDELETNPVFVTSPVPAEDHASLTVDGSVDAENIDNPEEEKPEEETITDKIKKWWRG